MKRHFILVATCLLAALGGSAKTFEWRISTPSVRAETFTAYHGETVRFNLVFSGAMSNVSAQAIYYQTNGMGSADYFPPIPGTVFAPSNDIGAAEYRFFIRCRDADGVDYTANGRLRRAAGQVPRLRDRRGRQRPLLHQDRDGLANRRALAHARRLRQRLQPRHESRADDGCGLAGCS